MQPLQVNALTTQSLWRFSVFNIILLIGLIAWLFYQNQPVKVGQPQLPSDGKLQCVSYSPYYHPGQTPLNPNAFIEPSQIDQDLTVLSKQFNCIRIYSVSQGLDYVPEAASKLGMQVYLGAWIGWVAASNDKELNLAISVANKHPKTVKALIVGNEVLLRGEQSESAMQAYLSKAKQLSKVPVTYADVWEFWRKHPTLESHVDFVTVHILPYWEDNPQAITAATQHVSGVMRLLKETFKKPILIGETGWPSVGRQRQASEPSLINQATYLRGFLQLAHDNAWQYNLIEAIDQPWKRNLEGTVGGYWGLYDTNLIPKFSFVGDIQPRHDARFIAVSAALGFIASLVLSLYFKVRQRSVKLGLMTTGTTFGMVAWLQVVYLVSACRNTLEWLVLGGLALIGWFVIYSVILYVIQPNKKPKTSLSVSTFLLLCGVVSATVLLIVDGRYRNFPISLYALPIFQLFFASICLGLQIKQPRLLRYLLSFILIAASLYSIYLEAHNLYAYYWLTLCGLSLAILWPKPQVSISSLP